MTNLAQRATQFRKDLAAIDSPIIRAFAIEGILQSTSSIWCLAGVDKDVDAIEARTSAAVEQLFTDSSEDLAAYDLDEYWLECRVADLQQSIMQARLNGVLRGSYSYEDFSGAAEE